MTDTKTARWEEARCKVISRWRQIVDRIDARDEGGVLGLANVIDEFCEEAITTRLEIMEGKSPPENDLLKYSTVGGPIGTRCLFCRGFQEAGGCFGMLGSLNRLVLDGQWDEARAVAQKYIGRLESMYFVELPEPSVH